MITVKSFLFTLLGLVRTRRRRRRQSRFYDDVVVKWVLHPMHNDVVTNSSMVQLELRVTTLEETNANQEARLTTAEVEIEDLEAVTAGLDARTASLENMTNDHEARLSAVEKSIDEPIAFYAVLTSYDTFPVESTVEFNDILLNQGNGYNSDTGVFTVPSGGDGLYYFSTYLAVESDEYARFQMMLNDEVLCTAIGDHDEGSDVSIPQATCSATVDVSEGDEVRLTVASSSNDTPLYIPPGNLFNGFSGFRI